MFKKYLTVLLANILCFTGAIPVYAYEDENVHSDPSGEEAEETDDTISEEVSDDSLIPSEDSQITVDIDEKEAFKGYLIVEVEEENLIRQEDLVVYHNDDLYLLVFYDENALSNAQGYYDAVAEASEIDRVFPSDAILDYAALGKDPLDPLRNLRSEKAAKEEADAADVHEGEKSEEEHKPVLYVLGQDVNSAEESISVLSLYEHVSTEEENDFEEETTEEVNYFLENDDFSAHSIITYDHETTIFMTLAGLQYIHEASEEGDIIFLNAFPDEMKESDLIKNEILALAENHTIVLPGEKEDDLSEKDNIIFVHTPNHEIEDPETGEIKQTEYDADYFANADNDEEAAMLFTFSLMRNGKERIDEINAISAVIENDDYHIAESTPADDEQQPSTEPPVQRENDDDDEQSEEKPAEAPESAVEKIKRDIKAKKNNLLGANDGHELRDEDELDGRGITDIETFSVEFVSGGRLETFSGNQAYYWMANRSTENHAYIFRIHYATSGVDKSLPGELEIRIPAHILRDRNGYYADNIEMSIPKDTEITADDKTTEYVYRVEGDDIVVYNRINISAAVDGYFEIAYNTSKSTFNYIDIQRSEPMFGRMKGKDLTATTNSLYVGINTTARIDTVSKKFPTQFKQWKNEWGQKPADADDWWYLVWEIRSDINQDTTQPYDLQFTDQLMSVKGWEKDSETEQYTEVPVALTDIEIVGFKARGNSVFTPMNNGVTATEDNTVTGPRYDYVLTRHRKSTFEVLDRYEITNKITDLLTPSDGIDDPSMAVSTRMFSYERPEFKKPPGHFISWKRADGAYRTYSGGGGSGADPDVIYRGTSNTLTYLGMKAAEYTRYDLEDFKDGNMDYLDNLDYATWTVGYAWPWTLPDGADWRNPNNYGQKDVHYSLTDETFYLHADGGELSDRLLTAEDFQIDTLAIGLTLQGATFNDDEQVFEKAPIGWSEDEIVEVYGKFGDNPDYVLIATKNLATGRETLNSTYVNDSTSIDGKSINTRAFKLDLKDNCVGFRMETTNSHYYTSLEAVPNVRLKNSQYVMDSIADWKSIAIQNTSHTQVDHMNGAELEILYESDDTDTDFSREIQKDSFIKKEVISAANNTKTSSFDITWRINMWETYLKGEGEQGYIPQETGIFYDLLPNGASFSPTSVQVRTEAGFLPKDSFAVETVENYKDTGRTLVIVHVNTIFNWANLYLNTVHDWDTINDFGTAVYNPVGYETGNENIKDGFPDDGGNLPDGTTIHGTPGVNDKALMSGLDPNVGPTDHKFIYADDAYDIAALTAANTGLTKKIKSYEETRYSYDTETTLNGLYSYRWRYQTPLSTKATNMIMFDSMENYGTHGLVGENIVSHEPDWKGTVKNVNISQLRQMGIAPVVYYSAVEHLDLDITANHDLTNSSVWTEASVFLNDHDNSDIKAIAVDMRKDSSGNDFVLEPGQSVSIIINMQAPNGATSDGTRIPETFNDIYMQNRVIDSMDNEVDFYIRHDYTAIRLKVANDVLLKKVSSVDGSPIKDIKFRVFGTSTYGNDIDLISTSAADGKVLFPKVEQGVYSLSEYEGTPDWLEDHTEHILEITPLGNVLIDGVDFTNAQYEIENSPRVHGDLLFLKKKESANNTVPEFHEDIWDPETMVKYAVALYGIEQDRDKSGEKMGLTFGPATGVDYTNSFKSHTPTGTTSAGNEHHCIHDDSWDEIVYWNSVDPYVYEQCIAEGCTHSVNLTLSEDLKNTDFQVNYSGDGPSVLYYELRKDNNLQHIRWNPLTEGGNSSYGTNKDGWGASRIRAMLNGADKLTMKTADSSYASSAITITFPVEDYTSENALIGAFPEVLRNAIGYKAVRYDSVYNNKIEQNLKTSYDKLWLLSPNEMGDIISITNNNFRHPLEAVDGGMYQRFTENGAAITVSSKPFFSGYYLNRNNASTGTKMYWWLRSISNSYIYYVNVVTSNGSLSDYSSWDSIGISPCFSLARTVSTNAHSTAVNTLIPDTTFKLSGTSAYGNDINMYVTSNVLGVVNFQNIEKGKYELRETTANADFVLNETVWTVIIDENGLASISPPESDVNRDRLYDVEIQGNTKTIYNEPRYWDFSFIKADSSNSSIWLEGAEFRLYGTSDLGTPYDMTLSSTHEGLKPAGIVEVEHLEKGTYILEEVVAPTGVNEDGTLGGNRNYMLDVLKHVVTVNSAGQVSITGTMFNNEYNSLVFTNDRALDGQITIIKHWDDDGDDASRPIPELHLSTIDLYSRKPVDITVQWFDYSNNPLLDPESILDISVPIYVGKSDGTVFGTVVFTPANATETNKTVWSGTVSIPSSADPSDLYVWSVNSSTYSIDAFLMNKKAITDDSATLNAQAPLLPKYAVSVYGIGQDIDKNGNTMGLTFGPATGGNYLNSFRSHTPTGTTTLGHEHRCIHNDSWSDIVHWNDVDPDVYEQCIGECCTKGVPLRLPYAIKNYSFQVDYTGDGPSVLSSEIANMHRYWNPLTEGGNSSYGTNKDGWGASRVRAMLNGADELTMKTANSSYASRAGNISFSVESYGSGTALISAFPTVLRDAIGDKAVKYDSAYNDRTAANLKTSYDKLWLLSINEVRVNEYIQTGAYAHPLEALNDGVYQRFVENGVDKGQAASANFLRGWSASSGPYPWMLRSIWGTNYQILHFDPYESALKYEYCTQVLGISPCFSLSRN